MSPEEPQGLPTEHMSMHVEHSLPGIPISVENHPVPTPKDALQLGNLTSSSNNLTQERRIPSSQLPKVPVPLLGHHEHMNPSLRPNIPERKGRLVRVHNISRDLTSNDPLEERLVLTHRTNPSDQPRKPTTRAMRVKRASKQAGNPDHTRRGPKARARNAPFEREKHKSRGGPGLAPAGGLGVRPPEDTTNAKRPKRSEASEAEDAAQRRILGVDPPLARLRRTEGGGARRGLCFPSGAPKHCVAR